MFTSTEDKTSDKNVSNSLYFYMYNLYIQPPRFEFLNEIINVTLVKYILVYTLFYCRAELNFRT